MKSEQTAPAAPLVLKVACIADGQYYAAGEPIPYPTESAVPPTLKPFLVTDTAEMLPHPSDRDITCRPPPAGKRAGSRQSPRKRTGLNRW